MFSHDTTESSYFCEPRNIEDQILELRSITTDLEFKTEEMFEAMDSLQRAINSMSLNMSNTVSK